MRIKGNLRAAILTIMGPLALGACHQSPQIDEQNASVADVAEKVRQASGGGSFVRPGQWESTVTIEQFDVPGMPAATAQQMRQAMAKSRQNTFKSCLTKEDAEQPKGKFFTGNEQCRYDHFKMGGGAIDAAMQCPAGDGMAQVMAMKGSYTPDSYDLRMSVDSNGAANQPSRMTMKMRVQSKRVGACDPAVAARAPAAPVKG